MHQQSSWTKCVDTCWEFYKLDTIIHINTSLIIQNLFLRTVQHTPTQNVGEYPSGGALWVLIEEGKVGNLVSTGSDFSH